MEHERLLVVGDRAIEGLPVRLVIALVVGIASLSVMLSMVQGIGAIGVTEVDVEPEPTVIGHADGDREMVVRVVDDTGAPVADATVVVREDTALLQGESTIETATTSADGTAELTVNPELGPNQAEGTLDVTVKPPAGSEYVDKRPNTEILVVEGEI